MTSAAEAFVRFSAAETPFARARKRPSTEGNFAKRAYSRLGHSRAIAESLAVLVIFDMISEQKRDETKQTSPTHCL